MTAPPPVQLLQMMMSMWVAQIAATVARLAVPDAIARGVSGSDDLARECVADQGAFYRMMRAATTAGLFVETQPRSFALTALGECLRSDAPGSLRDLFIAEMAPGHWLPWGRLHDAVKTGRPVASETLGMDVWKYYQRNHDEALSFAKGMGNLSAMVSQDVVRLYDPSRFKKIVDVGGSHGILLHGLLSRAPGAKGVLFDRPEVVADAPPHDRVEIVSGDFMESVPTGGDLYVLKSILHDWDDERCQVILKNVHRAAADGAHVLLVETILPPAPEPSPVTFMDMNMLVMLGGRERTAEEYAAMLHACGFEMKQVIPTGGMFGLIEAVRV